jgi:hypothetical protein
MARGLGLQGATAPALNFHQLLGRDLRKAAYACDKKED